MIQEEQVSVKEQAVFPGCVELGLRGAVGGEVQEAGQAGPVGALGAFLRSLSSVLKAMGSH